MANKSSGAKPKPTKQAEVETTSTQEEKKAYVTRAFDPDQIVTVYNGYQGKLVYRSKKTGESFVWDEFGAEQDMEIAELKAVRSSNKKFFINNWFMFDDPEIVDYLGLSQYYKFALNLDSFDKLFEKSASEIEATIEKLSAGQKKSVAYRAKQLINDGMIDSNKIIATLEHCLGVELVER